MEKNLKTIEIIKRIRPPRKAYLVGETYPLTYLLKFLESISSIWGSQNNFIFVPVTKNDIDPVFARLLAEFDPDMIEAKIHISNDLKKYICGITNPLKYFEVNLGVDPSHIHVPNHPFSTTIPIIKQKKPKILNIIPTSDDILTKLLFARTFGLPSQEFLEELSKNKIKVNEKIIKEQNTNEYVTQLIDIMTGKLEQFKSDNSLFISEISEYYLGRYNFKRDVKDWKDPFIMIIGDTLKDFCLYQILSSLRIKILWCPHSFFSKFNKLKDKDKEKQYSVYLSICGLSNLDIEHNEPNLVLTSLSLTEEELNRIKDDLIPFWIGDKNKLKKKIIIDKNVITFAEKILRDIEINNIYDQDLLIFNKRSVEKIETLKPINFNPEPKDIRWLTEIYCKELELPNKKCFNRFFSWPNPKAVLKDGDYRISKEGFVYFSNSHLFMYGLTQDLMLMKPYFYLPDEFDLFKIFYNSIGYNIKLSDKGQFQFKTQELFKDKSEFFEFFENHSNNKLLKKYLGSGINVGVDEKRNFLEISDIEEIYQSETKKRIDFLIERNIIYRGLILKCNHCRNACFYSLDNLSTTFKCKRCSTKQKIISFSNLNNIEPKWYYGLNEVIFQGYDNNMLVPILTLNNIRKNSDNTFIFIPEIELRTDPSSEKPDFEIDICCIMDGKLYIGECKSNNQITQEEINKYKSLTITGFINGLIFSTNTDNFNSGTLGRISELKQDIDKYFTEIKILTRTDLQ